MSTFPPSRNRSRSRMKQLRWKRRHWKDLREMKAHYFCSRPEDAMWYCGGRAQQRGLDSGIDERQRRQWWRTGATAWRRPWGTGHGSRDSTKEGLCDSRKQRWRRKGHCRSGKKEFGQRQVDSRGAD